MSRLLSVVNKTQPNECYRITVESVRQSEIFDTFEEAFVAFYNYIRYGKNAWDLSNLEKGMWIDLVNTGTNETINTKGLFDCLSFAKKLNILSQDGKLTNTDHPTMIKTVNKCFSKQNPNEHLSKL